jgi:hypothetical protein
LRFEVLGLGFGGLGFEVLGLGFGVCGLGFCRFRVLGFWSFGFRVKRFIVKGEGG